MEALGEYREGKASSAQKGEVSKILAFKNHTLTVNSVARQSLHFAVDERERKKKMREHANSNGRRHSRNGANDR